MGRLARSRDLWSLSPLQNAVQETAGIEAKRLCDHDEIFDPDSAPPGFEIGHLVPRP